MATRKRVSILQEGTAGEANSFVEHRAAAITPAIQNSPALARRWFKNRPPTTSGIDATAPT